VAQDSQALGKSIPEVVDVVQRLGMDTGGMEFELILLDPVLK
jgi:hypothetical protein